jgi:predicted nucleic acid-binding protein
VILVDTSVWVDHLRRGNEGLRRLLLDDEVLTHASVIGELACGQMAHRLRILALLHALPRAQVVDDDEALAFLEMHRLMGSGIGWVDVHILAATVLARGRLWTIDRRLERAASRLGIGASVRSRR